MSKYSDEQILEVCKAGYEVMGKFADVQVCNIPYSIIKDGLEQGLTSKEISCNVYNALKDIPLNQNIAGSFNIGESMHNVALYLQGEVEKRIDALIPTPEEPEDDEDTDSETEDEGMEN